MVGSEQVREILAQYAKHGWILRRVLLSAEMNNALPASLFGEVKIVASELDALWFSRAADAGREAWELRRLANLPFALVEVFEIEDEEEIRDEIRNELETRLLALASKPGNHQAAD